MDAAHVSPQSSLADSLGKLARSYPFAAMPTIQRNTFAGLTSGCTVPLVWAKSAGVAVETNKIFELAIESGLFAENWQPFEAPGLTVPSDFANMIDCQIWGGLYNGAADSAKVSNDGFVAIEFGSAGQSIINPATAPQAFAQLRQQIKDPTQWSLVVRRFIGPLVDTQSFTVPYLDAGNFPEGHRVALLYDPFNDVVRAIVDGVVRAESNILPAGLFNNDLLYAGAVLYSGTQTAPAPLFLQVTGYTVTTWGTGSLGTGRI